MLQLKWDMRPPNPLPLRSGWWALCSCIYCTRHKNREHGKRLGRIGRRLRRSER